MTPYRLPATRVPIAARELTPNQRFARLWFRIARRKFLHIPRGVLRWVAVYTEGLVILAWLWWRCLRMRQVIRVHRSHEPYSRASGEGTLTKFPWLGAWRRGP